jgi:glycosyltransferase involved in cell wall biosynthesis
MTDSAKMHQQSINELGKTVLYVAPNIRWKGGISSVVMEYQKAIPNFRYQPSTTSENIIVTFLSFPWLVLQFCWKLIVQSQIEIVHIHGASKGSFYRKYFLFLIAKYIFGKKIVYHVHGSRYHLFYQEAPLFIQKRVEHLVNTTDCVIVLSDWWKAFFEHTFRPRRIEIIPNIVGATQRPNFSQTSVARQKTKFLFLGRIGQRKGIYDLLEVLHQHKDTLSDRYHLTIGGDGETKKLQAFIKEYGLENNVEFIGFVTGQDKERQLSNADVYVLPSYNEGLPISILEAMAFGLPIISTKVGGIPEVLAHYENGIMIEAGDRVALHDAIQYFLDHPEKTYEYGARSYDIVAKRYFPGPVTNALAKMYNALLA